MSNTDVLNIIDQDDQKGISSKIVSAKNSKNNSKNVS